MKLYNEDLKMNDLAITNNFSLTPKDLNEAMQFSKMICESSFCPAAFKGKEGDVLVAVQMGGEIGLQPMQALQNIAVINGRPCVWGDALPALAKAHPSFVSMDESFDELTMTATCKVKRKGEPEQTVIFSKADAETAKLWGKQGPWQTYPKRMLAMRARGWAIRNVFPDALKGIQVAEEVQDIPMKDMGAADVVKTEEVIEPEQTVLPIYSEADFEENKPKWKALILDGKTSPQHTINMLESRFTLTDKQKKEIEELNNADS